MPIPSTLRALRYRDFRLFFSGQLISLIGTWMQNVAQSWLVYRLTGSSILLGVVGFCGQIPVFLLSPIGGITADRYSRLRIVIVTQIASMFLALVLAALTLSGRVHVWQIIALAILLGIVNAFDIPSRQAFITDMVGKSDMMNAIALNSAMFNGARIVGPAVAGILVASIGEGWCFFANGISYVAVILGLLLMRAYPPVPRPNRASALESIVEGFRFVIHKAPIFALLLLLGVISLTAMPFMVLMPIFADRILHGGARGLGLLMGASGVGALISAIVLAMRRSVSGLGKWVAVSAGSFGFMLILFSLSRQFWLSFALLIPIGFFMMMQWSASNTLIQTMAPDNLRGRVMAIYSMMFMGMAPVGALLAGVLAGRLGAPLTVGAGGSIAVVGAAGFALRLPSLRAEARELIVAQEMSAGDPPQEMIGGNLAFEVGEKPAGIDSR
jgi:MFS family permease